MRCTTDVMRVVCLFILSTLLAGGTACEAVGSPRAHGQPVVYTLSESPVAGVGGHDDRPPYQLQYPVGAIRLSDGRLVIADAGPREIRYYDAEGQYLKTTGGSGEGPGEFRNLRSIARIRGDTLVAWDPSSRRASFFASDGEFAKGVTLTGWGAIHEQLQREDPGRTVSAYGLHVTGSGGLVLEPFYGRTPAAMEGTQVVQDTIPLFAFDRSGAHAVEVGRFPAGELFLRNRSGSLLTFGERLSVAAGTDLVFAGSTSEARVRGLALDGEVSRSIALPWARRSIGPADVPAPGAGVTAAHFEAMPVPDSMPLFSRIMHGADERLWVQRYVAPNDESQEWLGFDEDGDLVGSLSLDSSMELMDIGEQFAIVLVTDELDVQEVRLYHLERKSS